MAIKSIVTLLSGGGEDALTLAFATRLALDFSASVRAVSMSDETAGEIADFGIAMGAPLPPAILQSMSEAQVETRKAISRGCQAACRAAGLPFGQAGFGPGLFVEDVGLSPWLAVAYRAGLTDLLLVGHDALEAGDVVEETLIRLGVPLLIGRGSPERLTEAVAIAWDGSLEASRAVKAALPFLERAHRIVALQSPLGLDPLVDTSFEALVGYLRLQGITGVEQRTVDGRAQGPALHAAAVEEGAGLLVAGAYGHGRVQEALFGGVTRDLLTIKHGACLLLAH